MDDGHALLDLGCACGGHGCFLSAVRRGRLKSRGRIARRGSRGTTRFRPRCGNRHRLARRLSIRASDPTRGCPRAFLYFVDRASGDLDPLLLEHPSTMASSERGLLLSSAVDDFAAASVARRADSEPLRIRSRFPSRRSASCRRCPVASGCTCRRLRGSQWRCGRRPRRRSPASEAASGSARPCARNSACLSTIDPSRSSRSCSGAGGSRR